MSWERGVHSQNPEATEQHNPKLAKRSTPEPVQPVQEARVVGDSWDEICNNSRGRRPTSSRMTAAWQEPDLWDLNWGRLRIRTQKGAII